MSLYNCLRVFADVVLNHMTGRGRRGRGIAGTPFDADRLYFPGVPYNESHFTPSHNCSSRDGEQRLLLTREAFLKK